MPELPEVETIAKQLNDVLPGNTIVDIQVYKEKSFQQDPGELIGMKIAKVWRKQKVAIMDWCTGKIDQTLLTNALKNDMTA